MIGQADGAVRCGGRQNRTKGSRKDAFSHSKQAFRGQSSQWHTGQHLAGKREGKLEGMLSFV